MNIGSISDEVSKRVLEEVERKLRIIISDSSKYAKHFNRDIINCYDVSYAI